MSNVEVLRFLLILHGFCRNLSVETNYFNDTLWYSVNASNNDGLIYHANNINNLMVNALYILEFMNKHSIKPRALFGLERIADLFHDDSLNKLLKDDLNKNFCNSKI